MLLFLSVMIIFIVLLRNAENELMTFQQAFRDLWSNERLLNAVEQLIGPEIAGHPVWNLRTKTPNNEASTVPWHQGKRKTRHL